MRISMIATFVAIVAVAFNSYGATVTASRDYVDRRTALTPVTNNGEVVGFKLGVHTNDSEVLAAKSYVDNSTPGDYETVSNAAISAAAQTNDFLRKTGGTMTGTITMSSGQKLHFSEGNGGSGPLGSITSGSSNLTARAEMENYVTNITSTIKTDRITDGTNTINASGAVYEKIGIGDDWTLVSGLDIGEEPVWRTEELGESVSGWYAYGLEHGYQLISTEYDAFEITGVVVFMSYDGPEPTTTRTTNTWVRNTADKFIGKVAMTNDAVAVVAPSTNAINGTAADARDTGIAIYTGFTDWMFSDGLRHVVLGPFDSGAGWWYVLDEAGQEITSAIFPTELEALCATKLTFIDLSATRHLVTPTRTSQLVNDGTNGVPFALISDINVGRITDGVNIIDADRNVYVMVGQYTWEFSNSDYTYTQPVFNEWGWSCEANGHEMISYGEGTATELTFYDSFPDDPDHPIPEVTASKIKVADIKTFIGTIVLDSDKDEFLRDYRKSNDLGVRGLPEGGGYFIVNGTRLTYSSDGLFPGWTDENYSLRITTDNELIVEDEILGQISIGTVSLSDSYDCTLTNSNTGVKYRIAGYVDSLAKTSDIPPPMTVVAPSTNAAAGTPADARATGTALYTGFTEWELDGSLQLVWTGVGWEPRDDETSMGSPKGNLDSVSLSWTNGVDAVYDIAATRHIVTPTKTSQLVNDGSNGVPFAVVTQIPAPVDISGKLDSEAAYPEWVDALPYGTIGTIVSWKGRLWRNNTQVMMDEPGVSSAWDEVKLSGLIATKQDALPYLTNAIPYDVITGGPVVSPSDPTFSNAVLSVGLNIDTNTVAAINALVEQGDGLPIGGATTVGVLLLALASAIAALKRKKADKSELEAKLDSNSAAPAFDPTKTYSVGEHVTYEGVLYECSTAVTTAGAWTGSTNWTATDMTSPDATLDLMADGRLRLVSADGEVLWMQGYGLSSASSVTLSCEKVNYYAFASGTMDATFTMPTVPVGKVGDFVLDVDNSANASTSASATLTGAGTVFDVFTPEGVNLSTDILTFAGGEQCELYFTMTAFGTTAKPAWKVVKQVVEKQEFGS